MRPDERGDRPIRRLMLACGVVGVLFGAAGMFVSCGVNGSAAAQAANQPGVPGLPSLPAMPSFPSGLNQPSALPTLALPTLALPTFALPSESPLPTVTAQPTHTPRPTPSRKPPKRPKLPLLCRFVTTKEIGDLVGSSSVTAEVTAAKAGPECQYTAEGAYIFDALVGIEWFPGAYGLRYGTVVHGVGLAAKWSTKYKTLQVRVRTGVIYVQVVIPGTTVNGRTGEQLAIKIFRLAQPRLR